MKKVLPGIINEDQTGFMAKQDISHNIRKILDITQLAKRNDLSAMIISIDFEACFDSIAHSAIKKALGYFNFGPNFIGYVETLLKDLEICVTNNGYSSQYIKMEKGTPQGSCISPYLALCVLELVALEIRKNNKIRGIVVGDMEHKLFQFADDLNLTLMYEQESLLETTQILDLFEKAVGLKVNYDKTSIYRIGSIQDSNAKLYSRKPFAWTNQPIKILGSYVCANEEKMSEINIDNTLEKVQRIFELWHEKDLSLIGKVVVINALMGSLVNYQLNNMPLLTSKQIQKTERIFKDFLWGKSKRSKIALKKLYNTKEWGGLKLVDIQSKDFALKTKWVYYYKNFDMVRNLANCYLPELGSDFWKCNMKIKVINENMEDSFWKDVAISWAHINYHTPKTRNQVLKEFIWLNSHIKIKGEQVFDAQLWKKGCHTIQDLLNENDKFMSFPEFVQKYGNCTDWLSYRGLISAIPKKWKEHIRQNIYDFETDPGYQLAFETITVKSTKSFYMNLIENKNLMRKNYQKWRDKLGADVVLTYEQYMDCFKNLFKLSVLPKYQSFQYRFLHRAIFLNKQLKIWKLSDTDRCTLCEDNYETIDHFFYECVEIKRFWTAFTSWFECLTDTEINLTHSNIMFNNVETDRHETSLNMFIMIPKQFLFSERCIGKTEMNIYNFKDRLKEIMKYEHSKALKQSKHKQRIFLKKWHILM